jgi:hypothetical protein
MNENEKKRYTVTMDAYIYAENDEEAKQEVKRFTDKMNKVGEEDHRIQALELHRTPFGQLSATKINLK